MKIFLTGSGGNLGNSYIKFLIKNKIFLIANYNKRIKKVIKSKFVSYYKKNILDKDFQIPEDVDILVHFASITTKNKFIFRKKDLKKNILINKKISKIIKKKKNIKKIIFLSSVNVYDYKSFGKVNENLKYLPTNLYGKSKIISEKFFRLKKKKYFIIRIPAILKKYKDCNFINNLFRSFKYKKELQLHNKYNLFNNIILEKEFFKFLLNIIKNEYKSGVIILGTKKPISLNSLIKIFENRFSNSINIFWKKKKKFGFYLNINKAIKHYNYRPLTTKKTIKDYIN